jgi:hypothetical protein
MNIKTPLPALLASLALFASLPAFSQSAGSAKAQAEKSASGQPAQAGKLIEVTEKDAAWAAKERQKYPLDVCVVSDEKLGSMGKSPEYIYRVEGKPDRLVVFCCSGCEEDFLKSPANHLAKIDAAARSQKK